MLILAFRPGQVAQKDKENKDKRNGPPDEKVQQTEIEDTPPKGPWGDRGVTSPKAGTKKVQAKDSSLNVRINLDLRADVALELHAVIQGDVTIGLF
jgi:hypothetical protein